MIATTWANHISLIFFLFAGFFIILIIFVEFYRINISHTKIDYIKWIHHKLKVYLSAETDGFTLLLWNHNLMPYKVKAMTSFHSLDLLLITAILSRRYKHNLFIYINLKCCRRQDPCSDIALWGIIIFTLFAKSNLNIWRATLNTN